ncbi:MAG: glycosyltransferase family 2 protein [Clostridiales bacterium]|nr:glycosyltransferase family 2 protein [Clostridiales bacterium]
MRFVDWELILRYSELSYPYGLNARLSNYYFDRADKQITSKTVEGYAEKLKAFDDAVTGDCLNLQSEKLLDISGYKFYNDKITPYETESRRVAVIIPNYEALHCLIVCLEAVKKYTARFDYEIIIVDNNSSQPVKDYLNKLAESDKSVKVILNNYNMGFTYAVNQGIKAARENSDIILLNNDAVVTEGWLNELYRVKDNIKDAGLIVPRQVLLPETKTMHAHVPMGILSRELDVNVSVHHHNVSDLKKYYRQGFIKLTFAPFFLVMITKECYEKLGLLDEENGRHYKSDRLYCQKAAENGIEVVYTPYSKAYHLLQQSTQVLKETDSAMYQAIFNNNDWSDIGYENSEKAAQSVTTEGKTQ